MPALFTLSGCCIGLMLGLSEAALLRLHPRRHLLLTPDVGRTVWIVAPLVDELAFAVVGLGLGLIAKIGRPVRASWAANLVSIGVGLAGAFIAWELFWLWGGNWGLWLQYQRKIFLIPGFIVAFAITRTMFIKRYKQRLARFLESRSPRPMAVLAKVVLIPSGLLIFCLVFYSLPFTSPSPSAHAGDLPAGNKPNIVLITLDTVRADHFSSYGYNRPTTPNLDRLAKQGVLFENAIAPAPWTLASHASMFTGLLPHQHGADFSVPLAPVPLTMAQALRTRGYETAGFSANWGYGLTAWGMGQGFDLYHDATISIRHSLISTGLGWELQSRFYFPHIHPDRFDRADGYEMNRNVYPWLRHRSGRPFFLFINYFDAHDSYLAPSPYGNRFGQISHDLIRRMAPVLMQKERLSRPLSAQEQASLVDGYDNCLAFLDVQVGELVRSLEDSPEWSNTLVIITADHGESFGEKGRYGHAWGLSRELLHVPLIILGRGVPSDRRISDVVGTRDLFSTVLDEAGGDDSLVRQRSLLRHWDHDTHIPNPDQAIVSELAALPGAVGLPPASISVITQQWHYIQDSWGRTELYQWRGDPLEKTNLAGSPQYQEVERALRERLYSSIARSKRPWRGEGYLSALHPNSDSTSRRLSPQEKELLKTLPYR